MFNRRLALSDNYDRLMELNSESEISIETEDETIGEVICQLIDQITKPLQSQSNNEVIFETTPNYLMFNMFADSKFYKSTIQLLKQKLANCSYTDSNYKMLAKYYYGLIYMQEAVEDMFLNNKNEKMYIFSKFISNLPDSNVKNSYLKILNENNTLQIICILQGIILKEFPNVDEYSDEGVEELYYIQLENLVSLTPNEIRNNLESIIMENIDRIFELNRDLDIKKDEIIQKTKSIVNKVKRNDN